MIRGLLKLIVFVVVVAIVGAFLLGYDIRDFRGMDRPGDVVGTAGSERARQAGAEIGQRTAEAADATRRAVADGALTSKIKAKMALDDTVKALQIDVDTQSGIVTLSGTVGSQAERERAVALARETQGVTQVVDKLRLK
ncbi:MAG TPA: BON domain-containing protein [Vicinamibacterales bacterium]|jgi:hyperosmotically inducible protein|nr:BON domain-containing protein [Vicinamibacterales bacterium]